MRWLCHAVQETGFATVLISEFSLEIAIKINRPAKVGEQLQLLCTLADTKTSELVFEESQSQDSDFVPIQRADSNASDQSELSVGVAESLKEQSRWVHKFLFWIAAHRDLLGCLYFCSIENPASWIKCHPLFYRRVAKTGKTDQDFLILNFFQL